MDGGVREIEVKYRVLDPDHLTTTLPALGLHLSEPVHQDDQACAERGWTYGMSKIGVAFARLRNEADRHPFSLKKPVDNELFDQVDHAGTFLELERLVAASESPANAQAELDEFARSVPVALQRNKNVRPTTTPTIVVTRRTVGSRPTRFANTCSSNG